MQTYYALVEKSEDGWTAYTPDIVGFTTAGDTIEQLRTAAAEGLRSHVDMMIEEGLPIPDPRTIDQLRDDHDLRKEFDDAELILAVPLLPAPDRSIRTNVNLDANLLRAIDAAVNRLKQDDKSMSRSGFLAEAARRMLTEMA